MAHTTAAEPSGARARSFYNGKNTPSGSGKKASQGRAVAILALATSTALTSLISGKVLAQTVVSNAPQGAGSAVQSSAPAISFNIPHGSLSDALVAFSEQAHAPLTSQAPMLSGKVSTGLQGSFTASEALSRLLQGSGLTFLQTGPHVYKIVPVSSAIMLGPVRVGGTVRDGVPSTAMIGNLPPALPGGEIARGGQLGMLGNRDVMDTPFNQTSYTEEFIEKRQIRSIRDALKDDPSVRAGFATGSSGVERLQIRGFNIDNVDISYGGLYGMMPFGGITSELAERVEVLRGPAALLNGMSPGGAVGGVVNIVPKRAHDKPLSKIEADYSSNAQFGGRADLGRRFGKEKQLGVRLNGMIRSGPTAIAHNDMKTALVGAGVDLRLHRVRLSTDFGYQYRDIEGVVPFFQLASGVPVPDAGRAKRNFNLPGTYIHGEDFFGVFRGEVDLFRNFTAYGSVGAHDYTLRSAYFQQVVVNDAAGNSRGATPVGVAQHGRYLTAEVGVRGKVESGPITQELAFSANRMHLDFGRAFGTNTGLPAYNLNVYSGADKFLYGNKISIPGSAGRTSYSTLSSLAFVDTLSALDKRIQVTGGLRVQRVQSANTGSDHVGTKTGVYDKTAISPSVLAVFKPLKNVAIYGNWIQGLQQGTTVSTNYANSGEIFAPYKSTQYEVGVKADLKKFILTFDVFQITQPSTVTNVNTNTMSVDGKQRNRGLELNIAGEITHGLRATGGLMLLDPVLTHTQGGANNGQRAANTSPVNFNMGLDYDLPFVKGLSVTADVMYTHSEYIENGKNRRSIPGWVRLDMGARYVMQNPASRDGKLSFLLNVDNITNERYWNSGGYNYLSLSAPRTVRFAVMADF
ncbi:TonB-dependent receptor [Acetobacter fabarum]|uniref:TonB-dependent siderophore receptor n=2 Tax=Acetobacter fabarum TaxID=483199 RepID=A0A269XXL3_9PROT|nr:TonB-dependent receptor [Acetobacter fabarum]PAK78043.1 TonB-dependent siderophore receptor [Acetobacter fabarum]PEN24805.1 TonB-dependent siderophore receptor [Acetobacter fabarum]